MNYQVIRTIQKIEQEKRTGVLTCIGSDVERQLVFCEGAAVAASSTSEEERLGEILVRNGAITAQHFNDVSVFVRNGKKMGAMLVALNIVQPSELDGHVRAQIREICSLVVNNPPSKLSFRAIESVEPLIEVPIRVPDIVMEAARRTEELDVLVQTLMDDPRTLKMSTEAFELMKDMELLPHEAFILSRISGQEPAHAVFSVSPLPEDQTARALVGHLAVGTLFLAVDAQDQEKIEDLKSN